MSWERSPQRPFLRGGGQRGGGRGHPHRGGGGAHQFGNDHHFGGGGGNGWNQRWEGPRGRQQEHFRQPGRQEGEWRGGGGGGHRGRGRGQPREGDGSRGRHERGRGGGWREGSGGPQDRRPPWRGRGGGGRGRSQHESGSGDHFDTGRENVREEWGGRSQENVLPQMNVPVPDFGQPPPFQPGNPDSGQWNPMRRVFEGPSEDDVSPPKRQRFSESPKRDFHPTDGESPRHGRRWKGPSSSDHSHNLLGQAAEARTVPPDPPLPGPSSLLGPGASAAAEPPSPLDLLRDVLGKTKQPAEPIVISDDEDEPSPAVQVAEPQGDPPARTPTFERVSAAVLESPASPPPERLPPPSSPPPPAAPAEDVRRQCRLCESDKTFSPHDFAIHLTFIHYKERIMKRIKWPYECLMCRFTPPENMRATEKADEMLMHYGCEEGVANNYYDQEISQLPPLTSSAKSAPSPQASDTRGSHQPGPSTSAAEPQAQAAPVVFECKMCDGDSLHDSDRLFVRHLSLKHFERALCAELPVRPPFVCPFIDCDQECVSLHSLMLHYGCEHNVSKELYEKARQNGFKDVSLPSSSDIETVDISAEDKNEAPCDSVSNNDKDDADEVISLTSPPHKVPEQTMPLPKYIRLGAKPENSSSSVGESGSDVAKAGKDKDQTRDQRETDSQGRQLPKYIRLGGKPEKPRENVGKSVSETAKKHADGIQKQGQEEKVAHVSSNHEKLSSSVATSSKEQISTVPSNSNTSSSDKTPKASAKPKLVELDMFGGVPPIASPPSSSRKQQSHNSAKSTASTYSCTKCKIKKTFVTQKSLNYHLVLFHYLPDVPNNQGPFNCLMCSQSFKERGDFVGHFVKDHLEAFIELHKKGKEPRKRGFNKPKEASAGSKQKRDDSRKSSSKSQEEKRPKTSTLSEALTDANESASPTQKDAAREESSAADKPKKRSDKSETRRTPKEKDTPIPQSRVRQTVHVVGELSARQRLQKSWQDTSIPGSRHRIEELEAKLQEMEEAHKQTLKKKAEEFERWIDQKEKALEEEAKARKDVEEKLEQASVNIVDLNKKLEQASEKEEALEASLKDLESQNDQTVKEKKALERSVSSAQKDMGEMMVKVSKATEVERKALEETEAIKDKVRDLEITITEKEDEVKELVQSHKFDVGELEKKIKRLDKQIEHHKNKAEKLVEERKEKNNQIKDLNKQHKEAQEDLKDQIQSLTKENKALAAKTAQERRQEQQKLEEDQGRVAELEQQLTETEKQRDQLMVERDGLLDSLDKLQKILRDFEIVLTEKNENIAQIEAKLTDTEMNLDEAVQKIKDQKEVDKEKKEQARQIKQLQSTMKDWESRQFTNVKLIAGLEKENSDLKRKVKDFEENNTGTEDELYELTNKCKGLEKDTQQARKALELAEQERAKAMARLTNKNEEVNTLQSKNLELQSKVQTLEKSLRTAEVMSESNVTVNLNGPEELKEKVTHQDAELKHAKISLLGLQNHVTTLETQKAHLRRALESLKAEKGVLEKNLKAALGKYDTVKKTGRDLLRQVHAKHDALQRLKKLLPEDSLGVKKEPENGGSDPDAPPPASIPELAPTPPIPSTSTGVINVAGASRQIVLNINPTVSSSQSGEDEDVDVDGGVSPPRSNYQTRTVTEEELRSFFPASDNNGPLTFEAPKGNSKGGKPSSSSGVKPNKGRSKPVDVTGAYDESEEDYVCGICAQYDPPDLDGGADQSKRGDRVNVGWVGCDCDRWFHKQCTKLSRFTDRFSCKSVKMKCIKQKATPAKKAAAAAPGGMSPAVAAQAPPLPVVAAALVSTANEEEGDFDPLLLDSSFD